MKDLQELPVLFLSFDLNIYIYFFNFCLCFAYRYNLGVFYFATDSFSRAKYQLEQAETIFSTFLGQDHPDTQEASETLKDVCAFIWWNRQPQYSKSIWIMCTTYMRAWKYGLEICTQPRTKIMRAHNSPAEINIRPASPRKLRLPARTGPAHVEV